MKRKRLLAGGVCLLIAAGALVLFPNEDRQPSADREAPPPSADYSHDEPAVASSRPVSVEPPPVHESAENVEEQRRLTFEQAERPTAEERVAKGESDEPLPSAPPPRTREHVSPAPDPAVQPDDTAVTMDSYPRLADPEYRARRVEELTQQNDAALERARAWAERAGSPMRIETNDTVMVLIDYTDETGPVYVSTFNANAAISTATDLVRDPPLRLSGAGILAGIWDGGNVRSTHTEFVSGRVSNMYFTNLSSHATHVAGTMIARGASASRRGMATNATLHAYDFVGDLPEMTSRAMAVPGETNTFQISNHSYGFLSGWASGNWSGTSGPHWWGTWDGVVQESDNFGRYQIYDRNLDGLMYDAPYYLHIRSAGNDRNDNAPSSGTPFYYFRSSGPPSQQGWQSKSYDPATDPFNDGWKQGGYNTIPTGAIGKNNLLVGAVNDAVSGGLRSLAHATMTTFSSWGPTDDGRLKPDVVGNGASLSSSTSGGDTQYGNSTGTSMSAPNVSGSAILLLEHYGHLFPGQYMRNSTIKALIIHTADDLHTPGPDYRTGWGLMNTEAAVNHLTLHHERPLGLHVLEHSISTTNAVAEYEIVWDGESPLRATLVWTDPPGPIRTGLNNTNLVLINDLDLRIIDPTGTTNYPWVLNPASFTNAATTGDNFRDNVEQVYIDEPATSGVYTVRITHKGSLTNGFQHYALMISGSTVPLEIDHTPLEHTTDTENPYPVYAVFMPTGLVDLAESELLWNLDGDTNTFTSASFTWVTNNVYVAEIPPQTLTTEIHYYIRAVSTAGLVTTDPIDAPDTLHRFDVTGPAGLTISGSPFEVGNVNPSYGFHAYATGNVVNANAELYSDPGQTLDSGADAASNYSTATWTNVANQGDGFGAWSLTNDGPSSGWFIWDSSEHGHGDINTDDVAFSLYGNDNEEAAARRSLATWADGYTFALDVAVRFRDGARGLILYDENGFDPADEIWRFEITHAGYGDTDWAYHGDMVLHFQITQMDDDLSVYIEGSSITGPFNANTNFVLTAAGTLGGFALFTQSPEDDGVNEQRNLYFNNLTLTPPPGPGDGERYRVTGWAGSGSVPASGATHTVSFTILENSTIDWQWQLQYALTQTSSVAGIIDAITWADANDTADTVVAPLADAVGATNYRFAEWRLDDVRQDDINGVSVNPVTNITMNTPRIGLAVYYPENQDTAGEGLPDWWQIFYFGSLGIDPDVDDDGDGYTNLQEYLDDTDPTDPDSSPEPPDIVHTPLADPQGAPAPWTISATITDNHVVASATLWWNRNDSGWNNVPLYESDTPNVYTNAIPDPGVGGDSFEYYIEAADLAGLTTTNGPHAFDVAYPILHMTPTNAHAFVLLPGTTTNLSITLTNAGNALLTWNMTLGATGFFDDMGSGTNNWITYGNNNYWHQSTNEAWSPELSWYCGMPGTRQYTSFMNAAAQLPSVTLYEQNPVLTFRHWMNAEIATATHAYHGGLVALSPDGGETFYQIEPVGGYPYLLADYGDSSLPFPVNTPIYSGSHAWQEAVFDLSAYAGQSVLIRFQFGSDSFYGGHEGWYVDDVRITPRTATNNWLLASAISGDVEGNSETNIAITLTAEHLPTGSDRAGYVRINSDDPIEPVQSLPLLLQLRTPPAALLVGAEQTSSDGTGQVTIETDLFNPDPETLNLELLFSSDNGQTWENAWIAGAVADFGGTILTNPGAPQILGVAATDEDVNQTNRVVITWATTNTPSVLIATGTLIRARAWDGFFWSEPSTSTPFLVDNEPPTAPTGLTSPTHSVDVWSTSNVFDGEWDSASDGDGIGVIGYGVLFTQGMVAPPTSITTTGLTVQATALEDATNWWLGVHAIDGFGNVGPAEYLGPFLIDATSPSTDAAIITIATSAYGAYTLSDILTNTWSGFADNLSGVAGFYIAFTDGGGTTNGAWITTTNALLTDAVFDETNTVYVWAQDVAGNVGSAASTTILVLNPDTDWDGSGMTAWQKEIAGLDATNSDQVFAGQAIIDEPESDLPTLRWPHAAGRAYTIHWSGSPLGTNMSWQTVTDPDYSVTDGLAVWTDPNPLTGAGTSRVYRIEVELE